MSVTPQTNATLEEIAERLLKAESICICGHTSPDGDAIGSGLALRSALVELDKDVVMLLADDTAKLDRKFDMLPGVDTYIHARSHKGSPDVFVCVDAPNPERIGYSATKVHMRASTTITVDHHASSTRMSDLSYTDPDAASTTVLIWRLAKLLGVSMNRDVATCALAGLMTDTGSFQYQNVDSSALEAASEMVAAGASPNEISASFFQRRSIASIQLEAITIRNMHLICDGRAVLSWIDLDDMKRTKAVKADCEMLINILRSIDGVEVACMLKEQAEDVRGSLRSTDDKDVSAIAAKFGGGGHRAAAGFTFHGSLSSAIDTLTKEITDMMDGESSR